MLGRDTGAMASTTKLGSLVLVSNVVGNTLNAYTLQVVRHGLFLQ